MLEVLREGNIIYDKIQSPFWHGLPPKNNFDYLDDESNLLTQCHFQWAAYKWLKLVI